MISQRIDTLLHNKDSCSIREELYGPGGGGRGRGTAIYGQYRYVPL